MTNTIDVKKGEKVLEIGTGSGYQSAYLSHLTYNVYTIEIIKPLAERTRATYDELIARRLQRVQVDQHARTPTAIMAGKRAAPFDKIIVTCGIDHIPPPLLQQLKPSGMMVIPVGPPGAQRVLKVVKTQADDGSSPSPAPTSTAARSCPSCPSPSLRAIRSRGRTTIDGAAIGRRSAPGAQAAATGGGDLRDARRRADP